MLDVDIIISTYKRHDLLREALTSVAGQTYPRWKCWIAEDGKSQETYETVKPFLQDNRFVHLPGIHAGFPAVPRNRGIVQGTAPYIAMLDDDDLWLPGKLVKQIAFMETHPGCALLGCNAFHWTGKGNFTDAPLYFEKKKMFGKIDYIDFINQNYIIGSSAVSRRDAVERAGLFNEDPSLQPGQDYELWLRLGALGEIWNMDEPLVVYRETPSTHYRKNPDRHGKYKALANIYSHALIGIKDKVNPIAYPETADIAAACCRERDFYLAGPRFLGRFRHEMHFNIKKIINSSKLKIF